MKVLAAAILILVLLVGLGTFNYYYLDRTSGGLAAKVEVIEAQVRKGQWASAGHLAGQLQASWDKISSKWTVLIDHQEIDDINKSLTRTGQFIKTKSLPQFMAESAELKLLLEHIPAKEKFNLQNIF